MSLGAVFVRARDGALYREPLWVFPEGFICFDEDEPPELVLWQDPNDPHGPPVANCVAVLQRVFGFGAGPGTECSAVVDSLGQRGASLRVVPGSDPQRFAAARAFVFKVVGRPPRPTSSDGTERHASRVRGTVFDWPAHVLDARALEIPE